MAKKKDPILELERKSQIMLSVFRLLVEEGSEGLTLEKVAKKNNMSKGLVSYYFKNKSELILETMKFVFNQQHQKMLMMAHQNKPTEIKVQDLVGAALSSREEVESEILFLIEVWSYAKKNPRTKAELSKSYQDLLLMIEGMVKIGVQEGYFPKKLPLKEFSLMILALVDGLSLHMTLNPQFKLKAIHQSIFQFFELFRQKKF